MIKFPTPKMAGHYWAKLIHPSDMPEGEDWASIDWEVVQVYNNNGEGDETWGVSVPGIGPTQWLLNFVWGPKVKLPREIWLNQGKERI